MTSSGTEAPTVDASNPRRGAPGWRWLLWGGLLLVGIGLRTHDLLTLPMSGDEFYSFEEGRVGLLEQRERSWGEGWRLNWVQRTHPLTYWFNEVSVATFGAQVGAVRVIPCALSILALVVLPLLFRGLAGPRAAGVLFVLLVFCPVLVQFARFGRYQSAAFLFGGVCTLGVLRWERNGRPVDLLLAVLGGGLAIASHFSALVLVLSLLLYLMLNGRISGIAYLVLGAGITMAVAFIGHEIAGILLVMREVIERYTGAASPLRLLASWTYLLGGGVVVLAAVQAVRAAAGRAREQLGWVMAAGLPILALCATSLYEDVGIRYFSAAVLAVLALAALAVDQLAGPAAQAGSLRKVVVGTGLICLLQSPLLLSDQVDGHRYDYPAAAARIRAELQPGDRVISKWHGILGHSLGVGVDAEEMEYDLEWLEAEIARPSGGRTFLVFLSQRGQLVFPGEEAQLRIWLEQNARSLGTVGRRRLDRRLYSFELRLFLVEGAAGAGLPAAEG